MYGDTTTGAESDIQNLTRIARGMVARWGMSDELGPLAIADGPQDGFLLPGSTPASPATLERVDEETRQDRRGGRERSDRPARRRAGTTGHARARAPRARDARSARCLPHRRGGRACIRVRSRRTSCTAFVAGAARGPIKARLLENRARDAAASQRSRGLRVDHATGRLKRSLWTYDPAPTRLPQPRAAASTSGATWPAYI